VPLVGVQTGGFRIKHNLTHKKIRKT